MLMLKHSPRLAALKCVLLVCALLIASPSWAQLKVYVDKAVVAPNQLIELTIENNEDFDIPEAELDRVRQNFDIVGTFASSNFSLINGSFKRSVSKVLRLRALSEGQYEIPAFSFGNDISKPITITVKANSNALNSRNNTYIETQVDPLQVKVQQAFIVSYKLFSPAQIIESQIEPLALNNAQVIPMSVLNYDQSVNGEHYFVHEFRFTVFAQQSGEIELPPLRVNASVSDLNSANLRYSMNMGRRIINLRTPEASIDVAPIPANINGPWLPASKLNMSETWSTRPDEIEIGQTLTRNIFIEADGVLPEHLSQLKFSAPTSTLKTYPDSPQKELKVLGQGVQTQYAQEISYVPTQAGQYQLPEVHIQWWNTQTQHMEVARLPAKTLNVLNHSGQSVNKTHNSGPNTQAAAMSQPAIDAATTPNNGVQAPNKAESSFDFNGLWLLGVLLLAAVLACAWYFRSHLNNLLSQDKRAQQTSQADQLLAQAQAAQDPKSALSSLLQWAQLRWPDSELVSLYALRNALQNAQLLQAEAAQELDQQLASLEKAAYGHEQAWHNNALNAVLSKIQEDANQTTVKHKKTAHLPNLYPED